MSYCIGLLKSFQILVTCCFICVLCTIPKTKNVLAERATGLLNDLNEDLFCLLNAKAKEELNQEFTILV